MSASRERSRSARRDPEEREDASPPLSLLIFGETPGATPSIADLRALHCFDPERPVVRQVPAKPTGIANGTLCDWRLSDEEFRDDTKFCWADKAGYQDTLGSLNATPRDSRCLFVEATHAYYIDEQRVPWSGTTFSHYCEVHFDADAVLARTRPGWARRKGLVRADGTEMSAEEIKEVWARNGESQSRRGTLLHWQIECHFNGYAIGEPRSPEFNMFLLFEREFLDALGLVPWRVEMNLFHCGLCLAGQADLICRDHGGRLVILDWKRSKEIREVGFNNERQRAPLGHLPNTNRHCYNLQLNTYRHILETEYGEKVSGMYLVILHPNQQPAVPHVYKVPVMEEEIAALVLQVSTDKGVSTQSFPGPDSPFVLAGTRFEEQVR